MEELTIGTQFSGGSYPCVLAGKALLNRSLNLERPRDWEANNQALLMERREFGKKFLDLCFEFREEGHIV